MRFPEPRFEITLENEDPEPGDFDLLGVPEHPLALSGCARHTTYTLRVRRRGLVVLEMRASTDGHRTVDPPLLTIVPEGLLELVERANRPDPEEVQQ